MNSKFKEFLTASRKSYESESDERYRHTAYSEIMRLSAENKKIEKLEKENEELKAKLKYIQFEMQDAWDSGRLTIDLYTAVFDVDTGRKYQVDILLDGKDPFLS